jgi:hypothetical protein
MFDDYINDKYDSPAAALADLAESAYYQQYENWLELQEVLHNDDGEFWELDYDASDDIQD